MADKRLEPTTTVILSCGQEINGIDYTSKCYWVPGYLMPLLEVDHGRAIREWYLPRWLLAAVGYFVNRANDGDHHE
jgi:hypothetical protein